MYAADISRLVAEAFPDYDQAARNGERFRYFLAGLDPALQAKCYEQGATDMEEALTIASRCEQARQAMRASAPGLSYTSPHPSVVATLNSSPTGVVDCNVTAIEKLIHAVFHSCREQRNGCRCDCGGSGCRSTSRDFQMDDRATTPQHKLQGGYSGSRREWSPWEQGTCDATAGFSAHRPDNGSPRGPHIAEERQSRHGVRFLSPSR